MGPSCHPSSLNANSRVRRKETWEARLRGAAQKPILNPSKDQKLAKSRLKQPSRNGSRTISRVLQSSTCPARFRVTARVVDFYPLLVENFAVLRCTSCNEEYDLQIFRMRFSKLTCLLFSIPARRRICTKCDESLDETHVKPFWRFFLRVEDEEGTTLEILVNNAEVSHNCI